MNGKRTRVFTKSTCLIKYVKLYFNGAKNINIKENILSWENDYDWSRHGEEWSSPWGGSVLEWEKVVYPRIKEFLPANQILEIAPGHGRWTSFLINYAKRYSGVDLSNQCIEYCEARFKKYNNLKFHKNNGLDLRMIETGSIDFIFSFDSLVHADLYIMKSYLNEIKRVLNKNGAAFIHHSNLAKYTNNKNIQEHVRARDVDFSIIKDYADHINLKCSLQEIVNWRNPKEYLIDCFSTFNSNDGSTTYNLVKNDEFMKNTESLKKAKNNIT